MATLHCTKFTLQQLIELSANYEKPLDYVPQKQDFKIGEVTEVIKSKRSGVMHTVNSLMSSKRKKFVKLRIFSFYFFSILGLYRSYQKCYFV